MKMRMVYQNELNNTLVIEGYRDNALIKTEMVSVNGGMRYLFSTPLPFLKGVENAENCLKDEINQANNTPNMCGVFFLNEERDLCLKVWLIHSCENNDVLEECEVNLLAFKDYLQEQYERKEELHYTEEL